jgi:hypothetical protein
MIGDDRTEQPGVCVGESNKRRMPVEERDFTAKLARAGQHLHTLEALIEEYRSTTAIELHRSIERRKVVWELAIEKAPPVELALVLGDFLYNVRSTLDYLAVALLPAKHKRDAYYPILAERIWEIPEHPGEPQHLRDMRRRWALIERHVDPAAVEIIKSHHPPSGRPSKREPMHDLTVLNGMSNRDRHQNLNLVAYGLNAATARFVVRHNDGSPEVLTPERPPPPYRSAHPTGAPLQLPPGDEPVEVSGEIVILVQVDREWSNVEVPGDMRRMWETVCAIVGKLEPYCR